jgi:SsrA-binding protein
MSLLDNKKAGFNYEFLDKYEAGLELTGPEVKTVRGGHGSLDGSYVSLRGGEAFLLNAFFPPYQPGNVPDSYDARRPRRLLLSKNQLAILLAQEKERGLTLVPLSVYNKGRVLKLSFATAKGKKKADKRETIKRREADREIRRTLKTEN